MPRYLDYENKRWPTFGRYFIVRERIDSRQDFLWFGEKPVERYWIDPTIPKIEDAGRGLAFLSFTGDEGATIAVA